MSINRVNIGESLPMRTVCYASVIVSFDPVVKSPVHANGCKEMRKWCEGITVVQRGRGYPRGFYKLLYQSI